MQKNEIVQLISDNTKLLNVIRCYTSVDRTILSNEMNLSWPTLQKSIDELKKHNIILCNIPKKDSPDTKKEEFLINSNAGYYIGISIGGSQIKICMIDLNFQILSREKLFDEFIDKYNLFSNSSYNILRCNEKKEFGYLHTETPTEFSQLQGVLNYILSNIIELNKQLENTNTMLLGIGFAFTGAVDNLHKEILKAYSLDCFNTLPIKHDSLIYPDILSYFSTNNISISFDNIVKAAIVSEKYSLYANDNPNGIYKNRKNIGCIYLGSGIGSAFILNNKLYRGTSNFSEIGHINVTDPTMLLSMRTTEDECDKLCSCGGVNCLEHKIRSNVFGMTRDNFRRFSASELRTEFLKREDAHIRLQILAYYISEAIKIITNILNLDLVILTGKLTQFKDELNAPLYSEKSSNLITYTNKDCSLVTSTYGALAPAAGAAILSSFPETIDDIVWY